MISRSTFETFNWFHLILRSTTGLRFVDTWRSVRVNSTIHLRIDLWLWALPIYILWLVSHAIRWGDNKFFWRWLSINLLIMTHWDPLGLAVDPIGMPWLGITAWLQCPVWFNLFEVILYKMMIILLKMRGLQDSMLLQTLIKVRVFYVLNVLLQWFMSLSCCLWREIHFFSFLNCRRNIYRYPDKWLNTRHLDGRGPSEMIDLLSNDLRWRLFLNGWLAQHLLLFHLILQI